VFCLNLGMANLSSLSFLGNVQWKLAKQLKNSDFYSIFHSTTVTVNLFEILEKLPVVHLEYKIKYFPQFSYGQFNFIIIFRQCSVEVCQTIGKQWFLLYFHNTTVTVNLFETLEKLPAVLLEYKLNCFPSIWIWPIQIH